MADWCSLCGARFTYPRHRCDDEKAARVDAAMRRMRREREQRTWADRLAEGSELMGNDEVLSDPTD